jgi:hypothetical protein
MRNQSWDCARTGAEYDGHVFIEEAGDGLSVIGAAGPRPQRQHVAGLSTDFGPAKERSTVRAEGIRIDHRMATSAHFGTSRHHPIRVGTNPPGSVQSCRGLVTRHTHTVPERTRIMPAPMEAR